MSGTAGFVTRKDGRIQELPGRVSLIFRILAGVALSVPVIMLLVGIGSTAAAPWWLALVITLVTSMLVTIGVGVLREGKGAFTAYSIAIVMFQYMSLAVPPYTSFVSEVLVLRGACVVGVGVVLYYLYIDLHYNLRAFWYSLHAMKQLQETIMTMQAKREAKKRGETFDKDKVIDAEAVVRAMQAKTGVEVPPHMQGINVRPGFRQEKKSKSRKNKGK